MEFYKYNSKHAQRVFAKLNYFEYFKIYLVLMIYFFQSFSVLHCHVMINFPVELEIKSKYVLRISGPSRFPDIAGFILFSK